MQTGSSTAHGQPQLFHLRWGVRGLRTPGDTCVCFDHRLCVSIDLRCLERVLLTHEKLARMCVTIIAGHASMLAINTSHAHSRPPYARSCCAEHRGVGVAYTDRLYAERFGVSGARTVVATLAKFVAVPGHVAL
eukprot:COSAG01_NODE_369_length_18046_cov_130.301443_3_plen_134_part_00